MSHGREGTPKSGKDRVVPIAEPLGALLVLAAARRHGPVDHVAITAKGKPWGDSGLHQVFKRAKARAGLQTEPWSAYSARHFFVTELLRRGAPIDDVRELAGHADLRTTQRYIDHDESDLRSTISLFDRGDGNGVETKKAS